ncbi:class A beta-lactamase [Streptomyces aureoverticillatus]|nr:class A beta-lactamase [Streptomyces aureoverticillatus]QIB43442.1 class A beta-lactamase [Streptomyces aureoverticillatus]
MTSSGPAMTRRGLLGAAVLLPLTACGEDDPPARSAPRRSSPAATPSSPAGSGAERRHRQLAALERKFDARLGVYALDTGTGAVIAHRADERFAFCSAFKALAAAAVLDGNPLSHLDDRVRYGKADLMKHAPITSRHVETGMTIRQLCDAAVRFSDGTAGNLLLRDIGGPDRLTAYARGLGDKVTRMDRFEPAITEATPGDPRDTSSPRAFGSTYREIVLGDALPKSKRAFLRDLLERNATGAGAKRIRAGLPRGWTVADKTGTGNHGTLNDIAVVWPPKSAPLLIAIMSSKAEQDAPYDEALLAEAAAYVAATLRRKS